MARIVKDKSRVREAVTRSVSLVHPSVGALEKELMSGRRLTVYLGIDPTTKHLHLGHAATLWTLRRFQDLGHKTILLIGDFTARIGDPTDKMAPRQALSPRQIKENFKTFKAQASRIIRFTGEDAAEIRYNSAWYSKMKFEFFMSNLLAAFSVSNLLVKEDFAKRIREDRPIQLQEFIYPLLQGWDGRAMGVDVEVGGHDQIFNMSIGRAFRNQLRNHENFFVAVKLLVNPNTGEKLSKTEASLVNLDDSPDDMFGRVMALPDGMILPVAELSTGMPMSGVSKLRAIKNPKDAKLKVATAVVEVIYGKQTAEEARKKWEKLFSQKEIPDDILSLQLSQNITMLELVLRSNVVKSKAEAWRLVTQGGLDIDGVTRKNPHEVLKLKGGEVVKIGKRRFFRVKA